MEKNLKEKLFMQSKNGFEKINEEELKEILAFSDDYINFLNKAKTERECTKIIKEMLKENGFQNIEKIKTLKPGDKIYYINRNKNVYAAVLGTETLENGLSIIGSHIDSPRLDIKPNPLYESENLALLKTHFYGGIKKYQWVNIPLSMHGIIVKANQEQIEINIGEKDDDPIFTIADLLPHLSNEQNKKTGDKIIEAEDLNILVGSIPYKIDTNEKVKLNILNILNQKYNITERDFVSAEIEFVPALKAKSLGFDKSMIAAYGQDDRVCAFTSIKALLNINNPNKTVVCLLADKEEVGSSGNTGMKSKTFDYFINELLNKSIGNTPGLIDKVFNNSKMLSGDVTAAYNPNFKDIYEKNNESYLGRGISVLKYTGSAGKIGASDANAEYIGYIRNIFEKNDITYQNSEMGKIGVGGGGTIAYILANKGIEVLDCGTPVMSMHSPYEITSKFDVYNTYKAYLAFYKE